VISAKTLTSSIIILFCGIGLNFVLKTINSIIYAVQKASVNNILSLIVSILPLCYIAVSKGGTAEQNLIALSIVHVIAINLPLVVATFILFATKLLKDCRPSLKCSDIKTAKDIVGFGMRFFLAQVFLMLLLSTNELYITRLFSSAEVVDYSIYYKLFTVVGSLFMLALTPLWSKITKDFAERKYEKIRKTNHFLYFISLLAILAQFIIVPILQWIIDIWLQEDAIAVNYFSALVFAAYGGIYILNVVLTTVANGIGNLKTQMIFYGVGAALKIPVSILLKMLLNDWGIIVLYNCAVLLAFCVFQLFWIEKKIKKLTEQEKLNGLIYK
jgi:O-antigen/teichoic acid export membrane protein